DGLTDVFYGVPIVQYSANDGAGYLYGRVWGGHCDPRGGIASGNNGITSIGRGNKGHCVEPLFLKDSCGIGPLALGGAAIHHIKQLFLPSS
ncbi:hypothetical protein, partial [Salmonella enterica]|uniref:hypothetical protein n=1 Tax=Salmonella enterica TaxID=28901 RepID=UPI0020C42B82